MLLSSVQFTSSINASEEDTLYAASATRLKHIVALGEAIANYSPCRPADHWHSQDSKPNNGT